MFNVWHDIAPERVKKDDFVAVIEITQGCKNKYELDKETGMLRLDRVLYTSTHYPANYGFIPLTYAEDNDPLDVLVLCQEQISALVLVQCHPIGVIKMIDGGEVDEKIIAVPSHDPTYSCYHDLPDLPEHIFKEISHFFEVYKFLEDKETAIKEVLGREDAEAIIEKCLKAYRTKFTS